MHSLKWLPLRGKGDGLFVHHLWRDVGRKLLWAWVGPSRLWQTAAVFSSRKVQTLAPENQQEHSKKFDGGERGIDDICCTQFLKDSQLMNLFWNFQWVSKTTFWHQDFFPLSSWGMLSFHISMLLTFCITMVIWFPVVFVRILVCCPFSPKHHHTLPTCWREFGCRGYP